MTYFVKYNIISSIICKLQKSKGFYHGTYKFFF
nr:MAG TPA: hypothetical protein [Caudoviricetes sp.]